MAAADGPVDLAAGNLCCKKWKDECSLLKEKRRALREAIKMLENGLNESRGENAKLRKEFDEDRARIEKDGKYELGGRIALQNEISSLKAENLSLQQKVGSLAGDDSKVHLLEARVSQGETEIKNLKEALKKEKSRVDSEKKKAESEKKRASEAQKMLQAEKSKAAAERKTASIEHQKTEDYRLQLEELKKEACEARSKFEEMNKKLEMEKQRANKEKQRADTEKAKAQEQRKLATTNERKLSEEKSRGDTLSREVEEGKVMIKKLREEIRELNSSIKTSKGPSSIANRVLDICAANKKNYNSTDILKARPDKSTVHTTVDGALQHLEIQNQNLVGEKKLADSEMRRVDKQVSLTKKYKKKALKEKRQADKLRKDLKVERERSKELQRTQCGHDSRKPIDGGTVPSSNDSITESVKLKLLKKQLKLEKMKAKHAKEIAELEKQRCNMIQRELHCIKLDFAQLSHRLSVLDSYFPLNYAGTDEVEKDGNTGMDKLKRHCSDLQSLQKYFQTENQLVKHCAPVATEMDLWHPTCRGSSTNFISGVDSNLGRLTDCSKRKKLKHSGVNSALGSFSDRELVGSQDRVYLTVNKTAELVGNHLHQQTVNSNHLDGHNKIKGSQNFPVVAGNNIRSTTRIDGDVVKMNGKKRKRLIIDVVGAVDNMCLESRKLNIHGKLMNQREEPLHCEEMHGSFGSDIMGSPRDYMKLLDLDDPVDEQRYRAAIGSPLSPTLPEINIEVVEGCHLNIEKGLHQRIPYEKENLPSSDASKVENLDSRLLGFAFSESNGSMLSCENEVQVASADNMPKYFDALELVAVNLGWDWAKSNIVPQLLKLLESNVQETSAVAIIVLIGQLGRLGVDAFGYEDDAVQSLRYHLFSFLCQAATSNQSFPLQTAIATSLISLLPLDYERVLNGTADLPSNSDQSTPACAIGKWFSSLSEEQKSSVYSLVHSKS